MNKWVRRSLSAGALTASALLVGGGAAQADTATTEDNVGLLNGTQLALPIQAPINVCGVAAAVGGTSGAECDGGAAATIDEWGFASMHSSDNVGVANGTQLVAPIQVPVNVCGIAVGVLGTSGASCDGGADAGEEPGDGGYGPPYDGSGDEGYSSYQVLEQGSGTALMSSGNVGLLNGTQAVAPVQLPINLCGVAVGVLGTAHAECDGGASADLGR